jgi:hypothetical protein
VSAACPRCEYLDYERTTRADGVRHRATTKRPSLRQLQEWERWGTCEATDGCHVEPDGICPHGHLSWLRQLGFI